MYKIRTVSPTGPNRAQLITTTNLIGFSRKWAQRSVHHQLVEIVLIYPCHDHHLEIVRLLTEVRDGLEGDPSLEPLTGIVDEVILLELQVLLDMRDPARPHSGMARQVLDELAPTLICRRRPNQPQSATRPATRLMT